MTHNGKIIDKDPYFTIDPISRAISNESTSKVNIIQFDHNSERFSFTIPRYIEEHDMYECNLIRVHYANIDSSTSEQTLGVYRVDDIEIGDDETVNFSWLLSQNVTQHTGKLEFLIEFACLIDEKVEYSWHTGIFNGITVAQGMNNNDIPAVVYPDILAGLISITDALPTTYADINLSNVSNDAFSRKMSEAGGGELAGGGGAFKRIGFSSDCDYIATASDGRTAFVNALADANDGDIIVVMPGEYNASTTLAITRDITFIGIDRPTLKFEVTTSGGGIFSYENWSWEAIYEPKHSKWYGFIFDNHFSVGGEANPDGECYHGYVTAVDCVFNATTGLYGCDCVNCTFNSWMSSGTYYGGGGDFRDCVFNGYVDCESSVDTMKRCEFHPPEDNIGYLAPGWDDSKPWMVNCKIYAPNRSLLASDPHGGNLKLYDTIIFANNISEGNSNSVEGGYIVQMTAK